MKQLTIRLSDEDLERSIQQRAVESGRSVNRVVVDLLRSALGLPHSRRHTIGHGLDHMSGDMSDAEARELLDARGVFEKIDQDFWS